MSAPEEFCLSRAIQMFALLLGSFYDFFVDQNVTIKVNLAVESTCKR